MFGCQNYARRTSVSAIIRPQFWNEAYTSRLRRRTQAGSWILGFRRSPPQKKSVCGSYPESKDFDPASVSILRCGPFARIGHIGKRHDSAGFGKVRSPTLVFLPLIAQNSK